MSAVLLLALGLATARAGGIDPACEGVEQYHADEDLQRAYMLNYFAMAASYSALHGPVPHEPGHGSLGLELAGVPPLSCARRMAFGGTKTEDTNKTPVIPRPRLSFTLPSQGPIVGYGSLGYIPPVTVFGTRNVILSVEAGASVRLERGWQGGLRFHATLMKTVGDIATAFELDSPAYADLFLGSTFGGDLVVGRAWERLTPYLAVGLTDASTFFYVGDDGAVQNNPAPFAGPTASVGLQLRPWRRLDLAVEAYSAPGILTTGRLWLGWSL